jgi:carbamoyl-phosphate synthase large chain
MSAALAAAKSLKSVQDGSALEVKSLQEYLGGE